MDVNDVIHWKCSQSIWGILKKSVELNFSVRGRRVAFGARRGLVADATRVGAGQMEKPA